MSAILKVLKPLSITNAVLQSSNVPENDYTEYSLTIPYALGDRVIVAADHSIYESLAAANLGNVPSSSPLKWVKVSATNRWKMFDSSNTTATTKSSSIVVTLIPGQVINAVGFVNVQGASVRVQMNDSVDGLVYDKTVTLQAPPDNANWYSYFFDEIKYITSAKFTALPSYRNATLTITINPVPNKAASCGTCLIGKTVEIGRGIRRGAQVGITDYSRKERNSWGDITLVQRAYSKKSTISMLLNKKEVDYLNESFFPSIRAMPTLWIGGDTYDSMTIFGIYKDFSITIQYASLAECSLEIEGLT
ncbi:MAG: hypothetical protein RIR18_1594 [Pseudomonadota bacterium]